MNNDIQYWWKKREKKMQKNANWKKKSMFGIITSCPVWFEHFFLPKWPFIVVAKNLNQWIVIRFDGDNLWYECEGQLGEWFQHWLLITWRNDKGLPVSGRERSTTQSHHQPHTALHSIIHHVTRHGRLRKPTRQTSAHERQKEEHLKDPPPSPPLPTSLP